MSFKSFKKLQKKSSFYTYQQFGVKETLNVIELFSKKYPDHSVEIVGQFSSFLAER